jgi:bifunctional non-homologous end joining protein LigD
MSFPEWLEPMAATLTQERFEGPEWLFERKYDGIRLLAYKHGKSVKLYSRNRLEQNLPQVAEAVAALPVRDAILDGEIAGGAYYVFDVMWLDGRVTDRPLEERRALLAELPFRAPMTRVEEITDAQPWDRACREGWEGVIAKQRGSVYEHRRSPRWLKMKCEEAQEFVIGGFTDPQGARIGLGALLVGYYEDGEFVYAGKVGTGFDGKLLTALRARLGKIERDTSPFQRAIGLPRAAHWVKPEVVAQIAFLEWTGDGKLRHSRFLHLRADKDAKDVVRESR